MQEHGAVEAQSNNQLTIAYEALQQKYNTRTGQQEEALRSKDVNITQLSGRLDFLERQAADDAQAWQERFVLLERQFSSEEQISQYWKGRLCTGRVKPPTCRTVGVTGTPAA